MICKICKIKTSPVLVVSNLTPGYFFNKKQRFSYLQCQNCKIVFIDPLLRNIILINEVYNEGYFRETKLNFFTRVLYGFFLYKDYPEWILDFKTRGKILDIGCGLGSFLSRMKIMGWEVYGTEINSHLVKKARKIFGNDRIYSEDPDEYSNLRVDVITLWHVLEHLENPQSFLKTFHKNLKKNGRLYIEVPNVNSLVFKIFKSNYTWLRIPDHIYYYSPDTLKMLLRKAGFRDISIEFPLKANLNFSFNMLNLWNKKKYKFGRIIFFLTLPVSFIVTIYSSLTKKSEVIRAIAIK